MVIGDILGDGILYYIGFSGKRFLKYLKVDEEKMEIAKKYFKENHHKAMFVSKLAHGIGFTGLLAAGAVHVPYRRYFQTCGLISVVQSLIMLIVGILFGHAYVAIGKYLDYYAAIATVVVLFVALFFIIKKYKLSVKP
jgi:membrane protein DedA with SNARE-associated domain